MATTKSSGANKGSGSNTQSKSSSSSQSSDRSAANKSDKSEKSEKSSTKVSAQGSVNVSSRDRESAPKSSQQDKGGQHASKSQERAQQDRGREESKGQQDRGREESKGQQDRGREESKGQQDRGRQENRGQSGGSQQVKGQAEFRGGQQGFQGQAEFQGGRQNFQGQQQGGRSMGQGGGREFKGDQEFNREGVIATLNNLLIADYDAFGLYERVLHNLDNEQFKRTVQSFRDDHQRHIQDLTQAIRELDGEPASRPSIMGPIAKVMASLASTLMGNKGALQALLQGEQYTVSTYDSAGIAGMPDRFRELVARNAQDEHRHLKWVTDTLNNM